MLSNRTPLYFAVRRNDIKAIRLLLDFHADVNITTNGILSSLHTCAIAALLCGAVLCAPVAWRKSC